MRSFRYEVLTEAGELVTGSIDALDISAAEATLHERGLDLVRLAPDTSLRRIWKLLQNDVTPPQPIAAGVLAGYVSNLSSLLGAGISISDALAIAGGSLKGRWGDRARIKRMANGIALRVATGSSLASALAEFRTETGVRFLAAVRAGEEGGRLAVVLSRLADELRARDAARKATVQVLAYPTLLALSASVALVVLLGIVVPTISSLIDPARLGRLPLLTRALFRSSAAAREWGVPITAVFVSAGIGSLASLVLPAGRAWWSRRLFSLEIARHFLVGRFLGDVELLLTAAVPLDRALRLAADGISNVELRTRCANALQLVIAGGTLSEALERNGVIGVEAATLLRVGERSGRLAERVRDAADLMARDAKERLKTIGAVAGPLLTIVFGLVCGLIATALLTTILSLNDLASS